MITGVRQSTNVLEEKAAALVQLKHAKVVSKKGLWEKVENTSNNSTVSAAPD